MEKWVIKKDQAKKAIDAWMVKKKKILKNEWLCLNL